MDRDVLAVLVDAGASTRGIGKELGLSQTAVRHWLRVHGQQTRRAVRNAALREARAGGADEVELVCDRHGPARHVRVADRGLRCALCRSLAVSERPRRVKAILVAEAGGSCALCGYDRFAGALHFHHVDPRSKAFHLAQETSPDRLTGRGRRRRSACCCARTAMPRSRVVPAACRAKIAGPAADDPGDGPIPG